MRRLLAMLAAGAVSVLTALSGAGPALAGEPVWHRIPCGSGAIDLLDVETDEVKGINYLTLAGHLDCADPKQTATFGYATYHEYEPQGVLYDIRLRPYATTAPTPFQETNALAPGAIGICVITDRTVRIGCVGVGWDPEAGVTVEHLPTDDPLVDRCVRVVRHGDSMPSPVCGTCW
ncbi:hypothetical protein [Plantactinospora sp. B5E13]|uniref:hypothetical protein n=1 Tax=Plantactinospora sp. B5E13 TaxID=3153758 RepID=UPI00325E72EB